MQTDLLTFVTLLQFTNCTDILKKSMSYIFAIDNEMTTAQLL